MNSSYTRYLDLEVDLSFSGASNDLLARLSNQPISNILTEAKPWENDLRGWIQFVRCDNSLICPDLVRHTMFVSMGLQFTDDYTISSLNSAWRKKNEKTDVLSFPVFDDKIGFPVDQSVELGDIVISLMTAEEQAQEQSHSLDTELRWLVSHGLLHLLGWDHLTPQTLKEMLCCQEQLLAIDGNLPLKIDKKGRGR